MSKKILSWLRNLHTLSLESWVMIVFGASFLLGIWYAFPMVNTVSDVWAFGGGVLRAMEAGSVLPGSGDVAYGTVSFYQNYFAMAVFLGFSFVMSGFDISAVKEIFILNPYLSLLVPRIVSAITAMAMLFVVYRFLKAQVKEMWWRTALIFLLFGNVITIFLTMSGKMWLLSMTLVTMSFIFLYVSITKEQQQGVPGKYALWSILTAALAAANFAFAALFFIAIPVLFFSFPKTAQVFRRLVQMSLAGFGLLLAIVLLNAENIILQVSGFLPDFLKPDSTISSAPDVGTLSLLESIRLKARHAIEAFPLFLLGLLAVATNKIKDKKLIVLASVYGLLYFCALVFVFRSNHDISLNVRHVFPIAIFLTFFLAGFRAPRKIISILLIGLSGLVYVYTTWLLSVPATYNDAYDHLVTNYSEDNVVIEERIFEFALPMNQASYTLFTSSSCASTCQYRLALADDIAFRPIVITDETDPLKVQNISPDLVFTTQRVEACIPLAQFGNPVPDDEVFDIDINLGRMLMPSFYKLNQLGKNLYLYQTNTCPNLLNIFK